MSAMISDGNQRPSMWGLLGQSWAHTRVLVARAKGGGPQGLWEGLPALCHCHLQPSPALRGSGEGLGLKREVDWGLGVRQFSMGLPRWLSNKESTCQCGRPGFDPWVGKIPGGGNDNPLQYSCLENSHGQRSLAGYIQWGRKESVTECTLTHF